MQNMTKTIDGAIVDWLEEIPLEELASETAQKIVEDYRTDMMDVSRAIAYLKEDCASDLQKYVEGNKTLAQLFGDLSEEEED